MRRGRLAVILCRGNKNGNVGSRVNRVREAVRRGNYTADGGEIVALVFRAEQMPLQHMIQPLLGGRGFQKVRFHFHFVDVFPKAVAAYQKRVAVLRVNHLVGFGKLQRLGIPKHLEQARTIRAAAHVGVGHFAHIHRRLTHRMILCAEKYLSLSEIINSAVSDIGDSEFIAVGKNRRNGRFAAVSRNAHRIVRALKKRAYRIVGNVAVKAADNIIYRCFGRKLAVVVSAKSVGHDKAILRVVIAVFIYGSAADSRIAVKIYIHINTYQYLI